MRKLQPTVLMATLGLTLVVVCLATKQCVNIPLPLAVFIGLGIHVVVLFWEHRAKLHDLLGRGPNGADAPPGEAHKA
jgi:hypothetical protein